MQTSDVLRHALLANASCIVVAHNHFVDVLPSEQDISLTRKLQQGCALLDIELEDHVIVSETSHFSFAENNLLWDRGFVKCDTHY